MQVFLPNVQADSSSYMTHDERQGTDLTLEEAGLPGIVKDMSIQREKKKQPAFMTYLNQETKRSRSLL